MTEIPINLSISKVQCLVPVKITFKINNAETDEAISDELTVIGNMDYARQELDINPSDLPEKIIDLLKVDLFEYFAASTKLPENKYEASEEVYDQAERAQNEHEEVHKVREE